jgi:L-ascorbate metabolism protein UlaG (beta-lactamase superfamily)
MNYRLAVALCLSALMCIVAPPRADAMSSRCQAIAGLESYVVPASTQIEALQADEVLITFVGHSTFRIESPGGTIIATDYDGNAGDGALPHVVTMNHAHSTHYTDTPHPDIAHVLRGWNPLGGGAQHNLVFNDTAIRNVPTDIRHWSGEREIDGNSIFIFEIAGLCIGHLGHLHHELTAQHIGWIGRLDVIMVPVDGSYTMSQSSMASVVRDLRARIVIPMHYFGATTLAGFIAKMDDGFGIDVRDSPSVVLSEEMLPDRPTILVLPGY